EANRKSLNTDCPHCGYIITPAERYQSDTEHLRCHVRRNLCRRDRRSQCAQVELTLPPIRDLLLQRKSRSTPQIAAFRAATLISLIERSHTMTTMFADESFAQDLNHRSKLQTQDAIGTTRLFRFGTYAHKSSDRLEIILHW